jgi:hypothetical protein
MQFVVEMPQVPIHVIESESDASSSTSDIGSTDEVYAYMCAHEMRQLLDAVRYSKDEGLTWCDVEIDGPIAAGVIDLQRMGVRVTQMSDKHYRLEWKQSDDETRERPER